MLNILGKSLIALFWLLALYNLFWPLAGAWSAWITAIALIMLVVHAAECVAFGDYIQRDHANDPKYGYVMVLLFGWLHAGKWMKEGRGGQDV